MTTATWAALADSHRRALLDLLWDDACTVGQVAERLELSQPQASKHLRVLREAGLVRVRKDAQRRIYSVDAGPMRALDEWLAPYRARWNASLDRLDSHLDREETR